MKKLIAVLLVLAMTLALCACGGSSAPKGEEKTWGNITVFVPDGWTLTGGDALDEEDVDKCSLKADKGELFDYINIYVVDEESVDSSIELTKEWNEGVTDAKVTVNGADWTGITYESYGYQISVYKAVVGEKIFQVTTCGYSAEDATVMAILESIK